MTAPRKDLKIDWVDYDVALTADGDLDFVHDAECVQQLAVVTFKTERGQWAFDVTFGVPWLIDILKRNPDIDRSAAILKAVLAGVDGVNRVLLPWDVAFDATTQKLTINGGFDTVYNPMPLALTLP